MAVKQRRQRAPVLLAKPFKLAIAAICILNAIQMAMALSSYSYGFASLPESVVIFWIVLITLAGVGLMAGAYMPFIHPIARGVEQAALYLSTAAFLSLGISILILVPAAWGTWAQGFILTAACIIRLRAVRHIDNAMAHAARQLGGGDDDQS